MPSFVMSEDISRDVCGMMYTSWRFDHGSTNETNSDIIP